jgi:O-antigen biosynthesis protein
MGGGMSKVSIYTPTHNTKYLLETYNSIKDQPFDEWVIVTNNGATVQKEILKDKRVKTYKYEHTFVGALKKFACSMCKGDILVELDHDDLLTPNAIEEVIKAFEDKEVGFVYSNTANFRNDFEATEKYGENYGWKHRDYNHDGHILHEHLAFNQYPTGLSKIWYCPNHIRAWRKDVYMRAGGHSNEMRVLDDQDLISRTFLLTKFKHIDKCLYLYRITGENTWLTYNKEIQDNVMRIHNLYIEPISLKWAKDKGLLALDMGASHSPKEGYKSCDIQEGCDYQFDASKKWPFEDSSVGVIRAHDFLEHIQDKIFIINEIYRVLAHGGILFSETPSALGEGAFCDPTHTAYYVKRSFEYYTNNNLRSYVPKLNCKFQEDSLEEITKFGLPYIRANLVAIKGNDLPGLYGFDR